MSVRILHGDCRDVLKTLPDASVHCCVTSPPYWGLRDYGNAAQIGLESTPAEYVEQMVAVFREVRRVLRDDGTLWLNLGDSYATGAGAVGGHPGGGGEQGARWKGEGRRDNGRPFVNGRGESQTVPTKNTVGPRTQPNRMPLPGLKPKDLIGIPWRVAFALQADGWYLRQDIIWHKPNPMPESVQDRCTKAHEYVFLLSKSARYFYNAEAIAEPVAGDPGAPRNRWDTKDYDVPGQTPQKRVSRSGNRERKPGSARGCPEGTGSNVCGSIPWEGATRNKRSVWTITSQPFADAHFATMPPGLAEACIDAGCPAGGVVLDPFGGAGTTGLVADRLQRDALLIELNPEYVDMQRRRITGDAPLFAEVA
jgi:DNA modification methylase